MFARNALRCCAGSKQLQLYNRIPVRWMSLHTDRVVDLRSDTVTRPTQEMLDAMAVAPVGDDVLQDDPTVQLLEATVARMAGMQAAIFFPSGTMSNLTAVMAWCDRRGAEMILGNKSHIYMYEQVSIQPTCLLSLCLSACLSVCLYVAPSPLHQPHTLHHHHSTGRSSDSGGRVPLDSEEPARWHLLHR